MGNLSIALQGNLPAPLVLQCASPFGMQPKQNAYSTNLQRTGRQRRQLPDADEVRRCRVTSPDDTCGRDQSPKTLLCPNLDHEIYDVANGCRSQGYGSKCVGTASCPRTEGTPVRDHP